MQPRHSSLSDHEWIGALAALKDFLLLDVRLKMRNGVYAPNECAFLCRGRGEYLFVRPGPIKKVIILSLDFPEHLPRGDDFAVLDQGVKLLSERNERARIEIPKEADERPGVEHIAQASLPISFSSRGPRLRGEMLR